MDPQFPTQNMIMTIEPYVVCVIRNCSKVWNKFNN